MGGFIQRNAQWLPLLVLLLAAPLQAQESFFRIAGTQRLQLRLANQQNPFQEYRPFFWEWEFEPTLFVAQLPISFYLLLSSERQEFRQNINAVTGLFAPENLQQQLQQRVAAALAEMRRDPEISQLAERYEWIRDSLQREDPAKLQRVEQYRQLQRLEQLPEAALSSQVQELEQLQLLSAFERFLLFLPRIEVGTVYPQFAPLALQGVALNGVSIDWRPGHLRTSFAAGRTRKPILRRDTLLRSEFGQQLYAVRVGWNAAASDFVTLSFVAGKEQPSSLPDTLVPEQGGPSATHVLELHVGNTLVDRRVFFEGSVAASLVTWDLRSPYLHIEQIPRWLTRFLELRMSSAWDWAYAARLRVLIPETASQLQLRSQMVGPGFSSFGNPVLRSDFQRHTLKFQQRLWKRRLMLQLRYSREQDNLLATKAATTQTQHLGGLLRMRVPRFLTLLLSAQYAEQRRDTIRFTTTLWQATVSHALRLGTVGGVTVLSYGQQQQRYAQTAWTLHTFTLSHVLNLAFPLQLHLEAFYSRATGQDSLNSYQVSITPSYQVTPDFHLAVSLGTGREQMLRRYRGHIRVYYDFGTLGVLTLEAVARLYDNAAFSEYLAQLRWQMQW